MYNAGASFASPGRQFMSERMYSMERADVGCEKGAVVDELVAEGCKLLGQLAEEDAEVIFEALARPSSPVARVVHDHIEENVIGNISEGGVECKVRHAHFKVEEEEEEAAVKIQALARGNQERKRQAGPRAEPKETVAYLHLCLLYTSPSPRDGLLSRMPSSA